MILLVILLAMPSLFVGVILRFADNPQWFNDAHAVGNIIWIPSAIWVAFWLCVLLALAWEDDAPNRRARQRRKRRGF